MNNVDFSKHYQVECTNAVWLAAYLLLFVYKPFLYPLKDLTKDANISIDWLTNNDMIANPSKFQVIFPKISKNQQSIAIQIKDK